MSTTARLLIDPAPELGAATKRYRIDCKWSVTTLWFSPGPIDFPEPHRVSIALQKHEDECGRCNLARLWREHGSPEMKAEVDRLHGEIQERMVARHLAGRRN
jgi:hypothetical protein